MRDIEFRAWDEDNGEMLYSGKDYEKCTFVCESEGTLKCYVPQRIPATQEEPEHTIGRELTYIMQFTGLKDNSGRKIFEGDIMNELTDDEKHIWPVMWLKEKEYSGWEIGSWTECEVIGNIHENPELLK